LHRVGFYVIISDSSKKPKKEAYVSLIASKHVYAQEELPNSVTATIYLAGPSPRDQNTASWRSDALELLAKSGFTGHVFIPLPRNGVFPEDYQVQAAWEQEAMDRSDIIIFWVPRELEKLPGFTTNVEFGQKVSGKNIVLGFPKDAPKTRFLGYLAERNFVDQANSLPEVIRIAVNKVGGGAPRIGGECQVPFHIWRLPHFQSWLQSQKDAGNRLDGAKVEMAFGVGPRKGFILYWAIHANIFVAAENRNKTNEVVIGRPDIKHVVAFHRHGTDILDTKIILVREFRSTAATLDGFIREVPGGFRFQTGSRQYNGRERVLRRDRYRSRSGAAYHDSGTTTRRHHDRA
jgi:hypothetical protein